MNNHHSIPTETYTVYKVYQVNEHEFLYGCALLAPFVSMEVGIM